MRRVRLFVHVAVILLGAVLLCLFLWPGQVTDVSADLRKMIKEGPLSNSRVYLDDLARHQGLASWSEVCIVLPYADVDASKIAPAALKRILWVGNWNEAEWRIAFLELGEVISTHAVKFEAVKLIETGTTGIVCASRQQQPSLRSLPNRTKYSVEFGTE